MNLDEREAAYLKQTGRKSLTPKQRRRAEHKAGNRAARFARQLSLVEELTEGLKAFEEQAKTNVCGKCGAFGDGPCITESGNKAKKAHAGRGSE